MSTSRTRPDRARTWPWPRLLPPVPAQVFGYAAAGWCLGFAGVSAWMVAAGPIGPGSQRDAAYASGLAILSVIVLVLKLAGAAVALAAVRVRPGRPRRPRQLLGVALWGVFGLLGLYSAGNLAITIGTVSGLLAPSAAWTAAGGVTPKAILYVLFSSPARRCSGGWRSGSIGATTCGGGGRSPGWPERRCCLR